MLRNGSSLDNTGECIDRLGTVGVGQVADAQRSSMMTRCEILWPSLKSTEYYDYLVLARTGQPGAERLEPVAWRIYTLDTVSGQYEYSLYYSYVVVAQSPAYVPANTRTRAVFYPWPSHIHGPRRGMGADAGDLRQIASPCLCPSL